MGEQARSSPEIWNERPIITGKRLMDERRETVQPLSEVCQDVFNEIYGQRRSLSLMCSNEIFKKDSPSRSLSKTSWKKGGADEIERGTSLIGPHRDDPTILLGGKEGPRPYVSQGEQRAISLALRLAHYELLCRDEHGMNLFLMDDAMSEMDEKRRDNLLNFISGLKQTTITSTNLYYFKDEHLKMTNLIEMGEGERKSKAC
ncbi:MAG: hypothetical protein QMD53_01970 [Actinomycetota bacterium]|nr:hypothetical protein [Actinomycetota bacterium]